MVAMPSMPSLLTFVVGITLGRSFEWLSDVLGVPF
jgi:hypothetical protein